jgi:hypothetical protein
MKSVLARFQQNVNLVTNVGMGHAGIVMGLEVLRLARNTGVDGVTIQQIDTLETGTSVALPLPHRRVSQVPRRTALSPTTPEGPAMYRSRLLHRRWQASPS